MAQPASVRGADHLAARHDQRERAFVLGKTRFVVTKIVTANDASLPDLWTAFDTTSRQIAHCITTIASAASFRRRPATS
jgi:hypothetical protein